MKAFVDHLTDRAIRAKVKGTFQWNLVLKVWPSPYLDLWSLVLSLYRQEQISFCVPQKKLKGDCSPDKSTLAVENQSCLLVSSNRIWEISQKLLNCITDSRFVCFFVFFKLQSSCQRSNFWYFKPICFHMLHAMRKFCVSLCLDQLKVWTILSRLVYMMPGSPCNHLQCRRVYDA